MQTPIFIAGAVLFLAVQCSGRALSPTGYPATGPSTRSVRGLLIMAPMPSSPSSASLYIPVVFNTPEPQPQDAPLNIKKRGVFDFIPDAGAIAAFNDMNKKAADSWMPKATPAPAASLGVAPAPAPASTPADVPTSVGPAAASGTMGFIPDSAAIAAFNDLNSSLNEATLGAWVAKATPAVPAAVPSAAPVLPAAPLTFGDVPLSALQARQLFM